MPVGQTEPLWGHRYGSGDKLQLADYGIGVSIKFYAGGVGDYHMVKQLVDITYLMGGDDDGAVVRHA